MRPQRIVDIGKCATRTRPVRHVRRDFLYSRLPGAFNFDAELDLWFRGWGEVRLELKGNSDIRQLGTPRRSNHATNASPPQLRKLHPRWRAPAGDSGVSPTQPETQSVFVH